jgi:hypothetical protein
MRNYDPTSDPNAPLDSRGSNEGWLRQTAADRTARDEHHEDAAIDMSENELHAGTGEVCPVCHRVIASDQAVRLRFDGTYQHDVCGPS